ncbi:MAG: glycoside hydrolase family 5 protein [Clostridiales bacterium]|nr:glycoside hydrolase family 5 protein [Clostridiales bacterium]
MKRTLAWILLLAMVLGMCVPALAEEASVPEITKVYQMAIPESEALAFTSNLKIGWNLGNTFDATRDGYNGDDLSIETYWCGAKTNEAMFDALKQAGFNTIRIPVSWHNHVDAHFTINKPWLDRVQEVCDWALSRDMYVILNIHHDVYPEYLYPSEEHYATAERYVTAIWGQLAERFAGYDEHLIFESMNEPRLKDTALEWWFGNHDRPGLESAECINKLNQAFVNTVRAAGGQNATRYLMVPGYCASPNFACAEYFRLPEDTIENRLIVSVHAYTPYSFALQMDGTDHFSINEGNSTREISSFMDNLYYRFIKSGIPVVIGEFGAMEKNGNLQDRLDFIAFYVASASARGIPCIWWDNHVFAGNGERFGLLQRIDAIFPEPLLVDALMRYAGYEAVPARGQ